MSTDCVSLWNFYLEGTPVKVAAKGFFGFQLTATSRDTAILFDGVVYIPKQHRGMVSAVAVIVAGCIALHINITILLDSHLP